MLNAAIGVLVAVVCIVIAYGFYKRVSGPVTGMLTGISKLNFGEFYDNEGLNKLRNEYSELSTKVNKYPEIKKVPPQGGPSPQGISSDDLSGEDKNL